MANLSHITRFDLRGIDRVPLGTTARCRVWKPTGSGSVHRAFVPPASCATSEQPRAVLQARSKMEAVMREETSRKVASGNEFCGDPVSANLKPIRELFDDGQPQHSVKNANMRRSGIRGVGNIGWGEH